MVWCVRRTPSHIGSAQLRRPVCDQRALSACVHRAPDARAPCLGRPRRSGRRRAVADGPTVDEAHWLLFCGRRWRRSPAANITERLNSRSAPVRPCSTNVRPELIAGVHDDVAGQLSSSDTEADSHVGPVELYEGGRHELLRRDGNRSHRRHLMGATRAASRRRS
jgi:hypothetical protein